MAYHGLIKRTTTTNCSLAPAARAISRDIFQLRNPRNGLFNQSRQYDSNPESRHALLDMIMQGSLTVEIKPDCTILH